MPSLFSLGSLLAMTAWLALVLSLFVKPVRRPAQMWAGVAVPMVLAVAYVGLLVSAAPAAQGGFGSVSAVRSLFQNDSMLTAGWLHYLAFDLFVGSWIARDGLDRGLHPAALLPCLVLTFLFGPSGLLLYGGFRVLLGRRHVAR